MSRPAKRIAKFLNVTEENVKHLFRDVQKCFKAGLLPSYDLIAECIEGTNCEIEPLAIANAINEHLPKFRLAQQITLPQSTTSRTIRAPHTWHPEVKRKKRPDQNQFLRTFHEGKYYIYRNSSYQATVHYGGCSFCKNGKGTGTTASSRWHGPFESRMQAMGKARQLVNGDVRICDHCGAAPPLGFTERDYTPD